MKNSHIARFGILIALGLLAMFVFSRSSSQEFALAPSQTTSPATSPSTQATPSALPSPSTFQTATPNPPTPPASPSPSLNPSPTLSPSPEPTVPPAQLPATYTVTSGDTLISIARKFGLSLASLIRLNPQIPNPNLIYPGQVITISGTLDPLPTPTIPPKPTVKPEISRGDTSKKQVIFTFDAGSGIQSADAILNVLKDHGVRGTFSLTGKWAEQNPTFTKRIASEGHEIINHTYSHPYLTQVSNVTIQTELQKTENVIKELTGKSTKPYFRPPYGNRNANVLKVAGEEGYQSIYWTVDALDWQVGATASSVKQRIYDNLSSGAIVLMHVGDEITGQVLDEVFTEIKNQGYTITSLSGGL